MHQETEALRHWNGFFEAINAQVKVIKANSQKLSASDKLVDDVAAAEEAKSNAY